MHVSAHTGIATLALALGIAGVLACAPTALGPRDEGVDAERQESPAPPERFPHTMHAGAELSCESCHPFVAGGGMGMPDLELTCVACHSRERETNAVVRTLLFDQLAPLSPERRFPVRAGRYPEAKFEHVPHVEAGLECATCHTRIVADRSPVRLRKVDCLACHAERDAPTLADGAAGCIACHKERRADEPPPTHRPATAWTLAHGAVAPSEWTAVDGGLGACGYCHESRDECVDCHRTAQPESHADIDWMTAHGRLEATALRARDTSCAKCHFESDCRSCHETEAPRDHTTHFTVRGHGLRAAIERDRCSMCHRQDQCVRCHQTQAPRSHTAAFGAPRNRHCVTCHEPVADSRCRVCHAGAPSHALAPPRPADFTHSNATDCRSCHAGPGALSHVDNGDDCRSCH